MRTQMTLLQFSCPCTQLILSFLEPRQINVFQSPSPCFPLASVTVSDLCQCDWRMLVCLSFILSKSRRHRKACSGQVRDLLRQAFTSPHVQSLVCWRTWKTTEGSKNRKKGRIKETEKDKQETGGGGHKRRVQERDFERAEPSRFAFGRSRIQMRARLPRLRSMLLSQCYCDMRRCILLVNYHWRSGCHLTLYFLHRS
jgi:hypothetical protein